MVIVKIDVIELLKSKWKWKIMNGKIYKFIIQQVVLINLKGLIGLLVIVGFMQNQCYKGLFLNDYGVLVI